MMKWLERAEKWVSCRTHHLTATHLAHMTYCGMVSAFAHELYAYAAMALLCLGVLSFLLNKEI